MFILLLNCLPPTFPPKINQNLPLFNQETNKNMTEREFCAGFLMFMGLTALIFFLVSAFSALSSSSNNANPPSASPSYRTFMDSEYQNILLTNTSTSSYNKSKAIFVMGDSSVDCGENSLFYPLLRRNLSLYPCSSASSSSLIPHFLATKLNLPSIPTFYEQNGTIEGMLSGLNYGSAQATILTRSNGPNFQSLNQQLRQALETIQLLQLQLGEVEAHNFISSSMFYLSFGKDDYINFLFENASFSSQYNGNTQLFRKLLVDEMTNVLRDLYDAGVRKVAVMGIYPLGCAPRAVVNWYFLSGRRNRRIRVCVDEINQIILQHNQLLNDHIINLNLELNNAHFVFCDVFEGFRQVLSSPQKFGFDDIRAACCGKGWHGAAEGCHSMEHACTKTSAHVWWDFYNPTEAVNSVLADASWSGQVFGDICHPISIQRLASA